MSLSYFDGMKPIKLPDPRIDIRTQDKYLFKQPANVVTYKTYNDNSSNNNSTHFTATPPNPNIIISPLVFLHVPMELTLRAENGANAAQDVRGYVLGASPVICPRQMPISSIIQTLSLKLNTDTTTVNLNDYIHALARFYSDEAVRAYEMSSTPMQPDFYQKYNDHHNTGVAKQKGLNLGEARSPFQRYGVDSSEPTRASYLPRSTEFTGGDMVFRYGFDEPLFISPLSSGQYNKMGLIQIQTFDLDITWDSNVLRAFSVNRVDLDGNLNTAGLTLRKFTNNISTDAQLRFIYMTPHINYPIPDTVIYEYSDINRFPKDVGKILEGYSPNDDGSVLPGSSAHSSDTVTSDNIQLSNIPNRVYIFARRRNADRNENHPDVFARIKKINIDFNGVSGILASASELDLWRMSCNNGAKISWDAWKNYGGSVLCIDFGMNLGLGPQQAVGMLGTYNFSYNIEIQNICSEDVNYTLYTVVESVGTLTVQNLQVIKQVGILTSKDVIDSGEVSQGEAQIVEKLYGGSFMSGMKNLYSNAKTFAKKSAPYIKEGIEIFEDIPGYLERNPKLAQGLKTGAKVAKGALKAASTVLPVLLAAGYTRKQLEQMAASGYTKRDFENLAKTMQGVPVGRGGGGNILMGGNPVGGQYGPPVGGAMMGKKKLMNRVKYEY